MTVSKLIEYFLLPVHRSRQKLDTLLKDENKVGYGFVIFLFLGVIYTVSVFIGYKNGFGAVTEPFIKIPAEEYYYWQMFYQIPFFILVAVLFSGTARLLAVPFNGIGSFEAVFAVCSVSLTFPMFLLLWIPESLLFIAFPDHRLTPLGGFDIYPMWADIPRQIAAIVWPLAIIVRGISVSEKIKLIPSLVVTIVAAIPLTAFMVIFIR